MNDPCESGQTPRHHWTWLLAPALAGVYPVLSLYVQNLQEATLGEAISCGVVMVVIAIGLALGLKCFLPTVKRASVAAVWILAWSFLFVEYLDVAQKLMGKPFGNGTNDILLGAAWGVILVCPLVLLKWYRRGEVLFGRVYQIVTLASVVLIALILFQGATGAVRGHAATLSASTAAAKSDTPYSLLDGEVLDWQLQRPEPARDIYLLVFDRYANAKTLQDVFHFDNSEFYDELEKRRFHVERNGLTCYPMTLLSMSSTLNMQYLQPMFTKRPDYSPLLKRHEVGRLLIDAGYTYHHMGNSYEPLRKNELAQSNLRVSFLPTEFADSLLKMTPLGLTLGGSFKHHFVLRKFAAIRALASDDQPTFTYAHFLLPHFTYVFNRDGSISWTRAPQADKQAYVDQLIATNRMILETIDELCSKSKDKPIIILEADEGPYLMPADHQLPREDQLEMRCGILSAILIPDEQIARKLPAHLAPVNVFRFLFREYFGAPLEMLPSHTFYWEEPIAIGIPQPGSRILDVTDQLSPSSEPPAAARAANAGSTAPAQPRADDAE